MALMVRLERAGETNKGVCVALCTGDQENPECGDPSTACAVVNDGVLNLCLDRCDPLIQDCAGDDVCIPVDAAYVCVLDASADQGAAFDPCEFAYACDKGLLCLGPAAATECDQGAAGCCLPYCSIAEGTGCPGEGQTCQAVFDPQPPGLEDVGIAADLARVQGVPSPVMQLTAELFRMAHGELGDAADHVEAARVVERMGGAEIGGQGSAADNTHKGA
jgi:hypothetical protein